MGWEYGIRTKEQEHGRLTEILTRLAASLTHNRMYSVEQHMDGFVLLRDDKSWPKALEVWLEEANNLDEVAEGEKYIYCLFHIWGEEGRAWKEQMEVVTNQYPEVFEWFEL
ncbi:hypothetical protein M3629_11355 [Paenibacillus polysaccharolyticus]|uniref:hypothetical protein n=1 Tax=Paenibacillus polysaccharolyticus TaxID=582692 RepID=UPI002040EEA4|nr:hypothetical protein [Paenibacillus polysaccharolyticus]MCM3133393.1 hypothetical protein [Paenibacillus polysaccharolyticus]